MIIARKVQTAAMLLRRDGVSRVAKLASVRTRAFLRANAMIPTSPHRRAALLAEALNAGAEFSPVAIEASDVAEVRASLLFPYVRRSFVDVAAAASGLDRLHVLEAAIVADCLFRTWDFLRLDACLPAWRRASVGTKFEHRFEQLARRVALRLGRVREAAAGLERIDRSDVADELLRGDVWDAAGRMAEARDAYRRAAHRQAFDPLVRLNLAFHLLKAGETNDGLVSWGVADRIFGSYPLRRRRPQWTGGDLGGQTLLVVFEHGLGDMIQFARFLVPLRRAQPRARIVGSVPAPLVGLFRSSFPDVEFAAADRPDPPHDVFVPSVLLAPVLEATSLEPTRDYIRLADAPAVSGGRRRARVGICWRGHPRQYEQTRSIPIELFSRLFADDTIEFVVLLNKLTAAETAFLRSFDNVVMPPINDFEDLGALVKGCDLVVSVDTAVVHLAGAGGRRCIVLSRPDSCWRWGVAGSRSPWYATVEVLRHDGDMDWHRMLAEVSVRLAALTRAAHPVEVVSA